MNNTKIRPILDGNGNITYPLTCTEAVVDETGSLSSKLEAIQDQLDNYQPIEITGNVTNAADEEDITSIDDLLKFKNRNSLNGYGYYILRRNATIGSQMTLSNTIYEIRYNFNISEENPVEIPSGCILYFNGGSFIGGTLVGNQTYVNRLGDYTIFNQTSRTGTWKAIQDINQLAYQVAENTSDITSLDTRVTNNTNNISTNTTNISTLTGNVSTNTTDISNLSTSLSNLTTTVGTNTTNISNLSNKVDGLADDEDLYMTSSSKLKFKDRDTTYGMGYKILRRDLSFKSQVESVTGGNTIFVIQYDFTLTDNVTIPPNCVLEFDGGSISGAHTITGNNTGIHSNSNSIFGDDMTISGTWNIPVVYGEWIENVRNTNNLRKAVALLSSGSKLVVGTGTHNLSLTDGDNTGISLPNDTELQIEGEIKINSNNLTSYTIVSPGDNCYIHGGKITGDKDTSEATTGEHGHGITIWSSGVKIENVEISNCWGDGIDSFRYFIVENCKIHDCRRQGISVSYGTGSKIINNDIYNIYGTAPQCCIDVEPNDTSHPVYDLIIQGNKLHDSHGGLGLLGDGTNTIKNRIIVSDNFFSGVGITSNSVKNLIISNNIFITESTFFNLVNSQDVIVSNNTFKNENVSSFTSGIGVDWDCKNIIIDSNVFNFDTDSSLKIKNCSFTNNILNKCGIGADNGSKIKNNYINGILSVDVSSSYLDGAPASVTNNYFYLKGSGNLFAFMTSYNNTGSFYFCNNTVKIDYDSVRAFYFCDTKYFPNQMFAVFVEKDNVYDFPQYQVYYGIKFAAGIRTRNYNIKQNNYYGYHNGTIDDISVLDGFSSFRFDAANQSSKTYNVDGLTSGRNRGTTAQRPTSSLTADDEGFRYFDTTLHKPIWYRGNGTWVDATGTVV